MAETGQRTYKIGQAARILDVQPYVLRFWESEFPQLTPIRTPRGQRLYTESHLTLLQRIKTLLYEQGLTIDGARRKLDQDHLWLDALTEIRCELQGIRSRLLSGPIRPSRGEQPGQIPQNPQGSSQEQGNQDRDQEAEDDSVDHSQK